MPGVSEVYCGGVFSANPILRNRRRGTGILPVIARTTDIPQAQPRPFILGEVKRTRLALPADGRLILRTVSRIAAQVKTACIHGAELHLTSAARGKPAMCNSINHGAP